MRAVLAETGTLRESFDSRVDVTLYVTLKQYAASEQGCPQDVKSQDRDETETFQKNVSRPQCRSLKTPTGEVCHLTIGFLWVRTIIFFLMYPKPDALHGCSQDLKSQNPETETETLYLQDRNETETLNPQDRDETETLNPQDRDETETFDFSKLSRPRRSTFKTETR